MMKVVQLANLRWIFKRETLLVFVFVGAQVAASTEEGVMGLEIDEKAQEAVQEAVLEISQEMPTEIDETSVSSTLFQRLLAKGFTSVLSRMTAQDESLFKVQLENIKIYPEVPDNISSYRMHVLGLGAEGARRLDGLMSFTVIAEKKDDLKEFRIHANLKIIGPVAVAKTAMSRGYIVAESDVIWKMMSWSKLATGAVGNPIESIVGRRVKSFIQEGTPLYFGNLHEAPAVSNGDLVELTVYSGPGVIIRSRGVARQGGRIGDVIRVEQVDTKKAVSGQISGTKLVEVRL